MYRFDISSGVEKLLLIVRAIVVASVNTMLILTVISLTLFNLVFTGAQHKPTHRKILTITIYRNGIIQTLLI